MLKQAKHLIGRPFFTLSGLPVYAEHLVDHPPRFSHDHDFLEVVFVVSGKAEHQLTKYKYEIFNGNILIIPPRHSHSYLSTNKLEIMNLLIDLRAAEKLLFDLPTYEGYQRLFLKKALFSSHPKRKGCLNIPPTKFTVIINLLADFIAELNNRRPGYQAMAISLFLQVICLLVRHQEHGNPAISPSDLTRIERTVDFMKTHCHENIDLNQLARVAQMSRISYQRSFRRLMNASPIKYLVQLRIRKAAALLLDHHELNITEIAFQAGFTDSNYFSRQFRRVMGVSPRQFIICSGISRQPG